MPMNNDGFAPASFSRRLAAFAVDAVIVLGFSAGLMSAWIVHKVGRVPLVYVCWSWTPLAGRRSIGKRAMGLCVIRE